jgi:tetraacyldisaccharide 4'-kinase
VEKHGCNFLIMDDGFQSAHIHIDYALLVVDARYGFGNGHVIPGGPLRARLYDQLLFADAILKMGDGSAADALVRRVARSGRPVFEARAKPRAGKAIAGRKLLAFAGIGHPENFFSSVQEAGGKVMEKRSFPDHHFYQEDELADLESAADKAGLELITTAKDAVRLHGDRVPAGFMDRLRVLEIDTAFDSDHMPERIIGQTLEAWDRRKLRA